MKTLSLFVSAAALLSASSAFAQQIDCGNPPSCDALGYTDNASECPVSVSGSKAVIRCPFDTTKGKCIYEAAVGQIAYFPGKVKDDTGWLPCDGSTYSSTKYPDLAKYLSGLSLNDTGSKYGNPFCEADVQKYHGSCSSDTFAVPDYRGYFLRVAGMWRANNGTGWNENFIGGKQSGRVKSTNTPQAEQLPNITGHWAAAGMMRNLASHTDDSTYHETSGAFMQKTFSSKTKWGLGDTTTHELNSGLDFDASKSNSIYTNGGHVIPASYSVYAYIYAGKIVK